MSSPRKNLVRFILFSALALGAILGLVWAVILREADARRISEEFEALRMATGLAEAFMEDPGFSDLGESVLGFGLYSKTGEALVSRGSAPSAYPYSEADLPITERTRGGSVILMVRPIGAGALKNPGMMRGRMRPRMMLEPFPAPPASERSRDSGAPPGAPSASGSLAGPQLGEGRQPPHIVWLEYRLRPEARREEAALYGVAGMISIVLLALYCVLLVFFRRNAELRERDVRNRELVELGGAARTLVHEIKNPLAVIRIQTAAMRRQIPHDALPQVAAASRIIDEEVERLSSLSDRIREFLKSGEGEAREVDLSAFLRDYSARYCGAAGGGGAGDDADDADDADELHGDTDCFDLSPLPERARVRIDADRLSQALDNLVSNAKEADPTRPPKVELVRRGKRWEIEVLDRGSGVPAEISVRIFEPFFTTKERGSGIGLALARRVVEGSGGSLSYRPREGGGSIFVVSLPALD
jgi:signal transduction histidine kinase